MDRIEKAACVETLTALFQESASIVVAHNMGLTAMQMNGLRRKMSEFEASVRVAKNRLVKRALSGTPPEAISTYFSGPTILLCGSDPISAPKAAFEFAKKHEKFVILGGALGETLLGPSEIQALAELPSLDELRGRLVGLLQAPASQIARVVREPAAQIARVLSAYADSQKAA